MGGRTRKERKEETKKRKLKDVFENIPGGIVVT
jgi:hypothetical protein